MIATFFLLFAFIRSIRWTRRSAPHQPEEQSPEPFPPQEQPHQPHLPLRQQSIDEHGTNTYDPAQTPQQSQQIATTSYRSSRDRLSSLGQSQQSIFTRSDSSATTTSSSGGTFISGKKRGDSTASTISTSVFSEQLLSDGRRSSEGTRLNSHRRSSGRIRRYAPVRTTIAGARRRTTGRLEIVYLYFNIYVSLFLLVQFNSIP